MVIMENPIKMDDLGGNPLFLKTSIWVYIEYTHDEWVYFIDF